MSAAPKMTPWFTSNAPRRHGVYQVSQTGEENDIQYAHYGVRGWGPGDTDPLTALHDADFGAEPGYFHHDGWHWRGLAEKPE